jgi:hypothetical protein
MKKIFTLLFAIAATVTVASAQSKDFGRFNHNAGHAKKENYVHQQHGRADGERFAPYQMNNQLHTRQKSEQFMRFEKSHSRYGDRRFAVNNKHRW